MPRIPRLPRRLAAAALVGSALVGSVLAGCSSAPHPASGPTHPGASALAPVFALVEPAETGRAWAAFASDLAARAATRAAARAEDASAAVRAVAVVRPRSLPADDGVETFGREVEVPGIGSVRELGEVAWEIEAGIQHSRLLLGFEGVGSGTAPGFRHDSTTELPVCLPEGEDYVSGTWQVRHTQRSTAPDGRVTDLEVTLSATLTATAERGSRFDVTGIHTHVRRTDTLPDGRTAMAQGSVKASLAGVTPGTWAERLTRTVLEREVEIFTRDEWMREDGFAYLAVGLLSVDVPTVVANAQTAAENGKACGGWSIVPVEMTNTVLNPLGDMPETRRWSGYVCGDPFTSAWNLTEEAVTFRGSSAEQHRIVPLRDDEPMEIHGVMPRIEGREDSVPPTAPFVLSFEERWPEGLRSVPYQRVYADVVPAGDLCSP